MRPSSALPRVALVVRRLRRILLPLLLRPPGLLLAGLQRLRRILLPRRLLSAFVLWHGRLVVPVLPPATSAARRLLHGSVRQEEAAAAEGSSKATRADGWVELPRRLRTSRRDGRRRGERAQPEATRSGAVQQPQDLLRHVRQRDGRRTGRVTGGSALGFVRRGYVPGRASNTSRDATRHATRHAAPRVPPRPSPAARHHRRAERRRARGRHATFDEPEAPDGLVCARARVLAPATRRAPLHPDGRGRGLPGERHVTAM